MFKRSLILVGVIGLLAGLLPPAAAQDDTPDDATTFTITYLNRSAPLPVTDVADVSPTDATTPAVQVAELRGVPGDVLSFAVMVVESNDLFLATAPSGIPLFDAEGNPVSGDLSDLVLLWDAGTEVNQAPAAGPDQAPRQAAPNTGADENSTVTPITDVDDGFGYPVASDLVRVSITPADVAADTEDGSTRFVLTIENTSGQSDFPTPLSPGVAVSHAPSVGLFASGGPASVELEALAEDGNPTPLLDFWRAPRFLTEIGPLIWVVLPPDTLLFDVGQTASLGIEALAEDGDQTFLMEEWGPIGGDYRYTTTSGRDGLAGLGDAYQFTVTARPGDTLTFVAMLAESNDWFYGVNVLPLFDEDGNPITGDRSAEVRLWDAGTERDEPLGEGPNQGLRQAAANTGPDQNSVITRLLPDDPASVLLVPDGRFAGQLIITAE